MEVKSVDVINFSALERELQAALEADQKHWRENDAKFRALHQKVGTYEEFRDIVLASHLRPLERKDKTGARCRQPWNSVAASSTIHSQIQLQDQDSTGVKQTKPQPQLRSVSEWSREWRCLSGDSRECYNLLLCHGGEALSHMFRTEVPFGLLGEFLVVLSESLQCGDESKVMDVLEDLANTARFSLNLALLSSQEKKAGGWLMHQLKRHAERKRNGEEEGQRMRNRGNEFDIRTDTEEREEMDGEEGMKRDGDRREEVGRVINAEKEEGGGKDRDKRDIESERQRVESLVKLYGINPVTLH